MFSSKSIKLAESISVPLVLPKDSHAFRYGGKKTARSPWRAHSGPTDASAGRYRHVCHHLAQKFRCIAWTRAGTDADLCTIWPRRVQKKQRSKTRRSHHRRVQNAAEKFGVAPLPQFVLQQGDTKITGILGMDTLYICHAIIDLDGMNLFLK